jgi:hypothetical protein
MTFAPSNCQNASGKHYFDLGYWFYITFRHELAARCFMACLHYSPQCALAHSFVALGTLKSGTLCRLVTGKDLINTRTLIVPHSSTCT